MAHLHSDSVSEYGESSFSEDGSNKTSMPTTEDDLCSNPTSQQEQNSKYTCITNDHLNLSNECKSQKDSTKFSVSCEPQPKKIHLIEDSTKREKDALRKRESRKQLSSQQQKKQHHKDAVRKQQARKQLSPQQQQQQRVQNAQHKQDVREQLSPQQQQQQRVQNAQHKQDVRKQLSPQQQQQQRVQNAQHKQDVREQLSPQQQQQQRVQNAQHKQDVREQLSPQQQQQQRVQNAQHKQDVREQLSPQKQQQQRVQNAQHKQDVRKQLSPQQQQQQRVQSAQHKQDVRKQLSPQQQQQQRDKHAQYMRQSRGKNRESRNHQTETTAQLTHTCDEPPNSEPTQTSQTKNQAARNEVINVMEQQQNSQQPTCILNSGRICNIDTWGTTSETETVQYYTCGLMTVRCRDCDSLMFMTERLTRSSKTNPKFGLCCLSGKVTLPPVSEPPRELHEFYYGNTTLAKHFQTNIRKFNCGLSMATMKTTNATMLGGIANFRIHGQVFRQMGPPLASHNVQSSSLQSYFYDPQEQVSRRLQILPSLPQHEERDRAVFQSLQSVLLQYNSYLQSFMDIHQIVESGQLPKEIFITIHADKKPERDHARRYNLPTSNEVAILLPNHNTPAQNRTIVCALQVQENGNRGLQSFSDTHRSYDPLSYPLLFPYGTDGYHLNIPHQLGQHHVTAMQFYAYRLMQRDPNHSILHSGRRLLQQYMVDMWAKVETGRLNFLRFHQKDLRADLYRGLQDALHVGDADRAGHRIILPATFTGGPRFMAKHYQDAMAIVRKFGKPTFFITFTCNAQWSEIVSELRSNQTASDRPDLTARVFKLKQQQLLADIKNGVLGPLLAHVYTIEFQKRGLPHCHFLFIMQGDQHTWQDVDNVICAEIPDPNNPYTQTLHNYVMKFMIHGPCGKDNPKSPCMSKGECTKMYPRDFNTQTRIGDDSYPLYRRRPPGQNGHTGHIYVSSAKKSMEIDNRYVVPYNPYLLLRFKSHINVEYCASIKAVKYLYKYIFKGTDQATISFQEDNNVQEPKETQKDEIKEYESCRYIGASEAAWRIFGFQTQDRYPAVDSLPVHLPNEQYVTFDPADPQKALDSATKTKLTAYFEQNTHDPEAREILYCDFPQFYTWNNQQKKWKKRSSPSKEKPRTIGRVFTVHPNQGETFYLRLLLHHKSGSVSFDDLRTIEGKTWSTFKEACIQLNLLQDDNEWHECLTEASNTHSAVNMRGLFVSILLFCDPTDPLKLFQDYASHFSDDFKYKRRKLQLPEEQIECAALNDLLCDLDDRLQPHNKTTADFGLPPPDRSQRNKLDLAADELDPGAQTAFNEYISQLNADQAQSFKVIETKLGQKQGGLIFIDAPGGTGKTYLLNTVLAYVRKNQGIALATASSGIAATLLKLGRTAHSRFKLPIPPQATSTCNISPQDPNGLLLQAADLLVWDEAPMSHRYLLEALDRTLQDIMNNDAMFGGKLLILAGDFRQILPVVRRGRRPNIVDACMTKSPLWQHCVKLQLRINMRAKTAASQGNSEDQERVHHYANWLIQLGEGQLLSAKHPMYHDAIEIPLDLCAKSEEEIISHVYEGVDHPQNHTNPHWLKERAILTSTNKDVDRLNEIIMSKLPGASTVLVSADTVADQNQATTYPTEFLNSINISGMPPHRMSLKINAPIMLLRNMDPKHGHCNGSRYILTGISQRLLQAKLLSGEHAGATLLIPRILLCPSDTDLPFTLRRRQFPVRPAFCMTINKSQGQSLKCCGLYLPSSVFTHGQLYVAASRVGDPKGFRIYANQSEFLIKEGSATTNNYLTRNVVYPEVL